MNKLVNKLFLETNQPTFRSGLKVYATIYRQLTK